MSAVCEICGKEFKTTQGLKGHKTFVHQSTSFSGKSATPPATEQLLSSNLGTRVATEQQVSKLEDRLQKLERVTGLRETEPADLLNDLLSNTEPLTYQLASITRQLSKQAEQLSKLSDTVSKLSELQQRLALMATRSETNHIATKVELLSKSVEKHDHWLNPESDDEVILEIIGGPIGYLKKCIEDLSSSRQIKGSS